MHIWYHSLPVYDFTAWNVGRKREGGEREGEREREREGEREREKREARERERDEIDILLC